MVLLLLCGIKKKIKNHKESKKHVAARGWKVGALERGWLKVQIFSYEINKVWELIYNMVTIADNTGIIQQVC